MKSDERETAWPSRITRIVGLSEKRQPKSCAVKEERTLVVLHELLVPLGQIADVDPACASVKSLRGENNGSPTHFFHPARHNASAYILPIAPIPMSPIVGCSSTADDGDTWGLTLIGTALYAWLESPADDVPAGVAMRLDVIGGVFKMNVMESVTR